MAFGLKKIIRLFNSGNVCVTGLIGTGKDTLLGNVLMRMKKPYVSNFDYGGVRYPLVMSDFDCGRNTYKNFISGNLNYYKFPYPDNTQVVISDLGIYFPAQYCNELNRDYGYFATFMALPRQLGKSNVHFNVQNLNRAWDKIREQSDIYIRCLGCKWLFGKLVFQKVIVYERYESCVNRVPVFPVRKPLLNPNRRLTWELAYANYEIAHGKISPYFLVYWNKSKHDTRVFKSMLEGGKKPDE